MFLSWWLSVVGHAQTKTKAAKKAQRRRVPSKFRSALNVEHLEDRLVPTSGTANVFLNLQNSALQLNTLTATRGSTVPVFIDFDTVTPSSSGGVGTGKYYLQYDPAVLSVSETATAVGPDIKLGSLLSGLAASYNLTPGPNTPGVVAINLNHTGSTFLSGVPTGHLIEVDFHVVGSTPRFGAGTLLDMQNGPSFSNSQTDSGGTAYSFIATPTAYVGSSLTQTGATAPATFTPPDLDPDDASLQIVTKTPNLAPTAIADTYDMAPNSPSFSSTMTLTGPTNGVLGNDTKTANGPATALLTTAGATTTPLPASQSEIATASENGMVVTITTVTTHNLLPGESVTIAGVTASGYNGTYDIATVPDDTHFTYNVDPTNPAKLNLPFNSGSGSPTATTAATTIYSANTANGNVWLNAADGTFAYTPAVGFTGSDSFTYEAVDAVSNTASAPATVTLYVGGLMNIPQGISTDSTSAPITIGSKVIVPVNVFNPNPINSGGLANVTIGINYDASVFDPHNITISKGALSLAAGWNQLTSNTNSAGQIVITTSLIGGGNAITSTSPGSIALITFNVIGLPTNANHTSVINLSETNPQTSDLDVIGAGNFAQLPLAFATADNTNFNGSPGTDDGSVQFAGVTNGNTTTTAISATVNGSPVSTITYGTKVTLTAVVTDTSGNTPPTVGSVDFKDGTTDLGLSKTPGTQTGNTTTFVLVTTVNQLQVSQANAGVHTITASYTDGTSFLGSSITISGGLAVTPAPLSITAQTNSKVYDGTTSATATPTVSGLVGTDRVTALAEVYSDKNSGASKTLSVSAYTINDGNNGNDYIVTNINNTTGIVGKASLTITATANAKTYDSTITAAATPAVVGLQGGDSIVGLSEVYDTKNVGVNKTLSVLMSPTFYAGAPLINPPNGMSGANAMVIDGNDNLYIAAGNTVIKFARGATTPTATLTGLNGANSLAVDKSGDLFVSNSGNNTVSEFQPGALTPSATLTGVTNPGPIVVDGNGNLYVANHFKIANQDDTVSMFAPGHITPSATITASGLSNPSALSVNPDNDLLVASAGNTSSQNIVFEFSPGSSNVIGGSFDSADITSIISPGSGYFAAHGQANGVGEITFTHGVDIFYGGLSDPVALASGGNGSHNGIYVVNNGNNTVSKLALSNSVAMPPLTGLVNPVALFL